MIACCVDAGPAAHAAGDTPPPSPHAASADHADSANDVASDRVTIDRGHDTTDKGPCFDHGRERIEHLQK
jgi:hypothetical protein